MEFYVELEDKTTIFIPDCCTSPDDNCCEIESEYITCQATGTSNCFWNDVESQSFYWYFYNTDYVGENTLYFEFYALYLTGTSNDGTYESYDIGTDYCIIDVIVPCIDETLTDPVEVLLLQ
jgi:hypothetical protein